MFDPKEKETYAQILEMAKRGNEEAVKYLKRTYKLYVYTYEMVKRVNALIEKGASRDEAIKQVKEERNGYSED